VTGLATGAGDEGRLSFSEAAPQTLVLALEGSWTLKGRLPSPDDVIKRLQSGPKIECLRFDASRLAGWDSGLLTFLVAVRRSCEEENIALDVAGLPQGVQRLLTLAAAVPEKVGARKVQQRQPLLAQIGLGAHAAWVALTEAVTFVGEVSLAFARLLLGRAKLRRSDLMLVVQQCGAEALPIVALISVLVGVILAFVGAIQLQQFGAQIFIANLVGIGMAREMGAMMAAIIMAGRTGAAFAAQIGTMQVNEEIDALKTLGIAPMDFLVLPRMTALIVMMPLLCLYAIVLGILGGAIVGVGILGLSPEQYLNQTVQALRLNDFAVGIFKSSVFGVLIAASGCLRGLQCGRSAAEVGSAATSAVVTAIVLIVVADGLFAVLTNALGI
jgi:phospholipid/cholesterol/gamma-HCH transport system permease protein